MLPLEYAPFQTQLKVIITVTLSQSYFYIIIVLDFDSTRRTVVFGPADTHRLLNVSINNEAEIESEENFTLLIQLGRAAVRIGVQLGDPSETIVVIYDDDEGN